MKTNEQAPEPCQYRVVQSDRGVWFLWRGVPDGESDSGTRWEMLGEVELRPVPETQAPVEPLTERNRLTRLNAVLDKFPPILPGSPYVYDEAILQLERVAKRHHQQDGELQSRAEQSGNPSSSALAVGRSATSDRSTDGPQREPVTADSQGQPRSDEASTPLSPQLSAELKCLKCGHGQPHTGGADRDRCQRLYDDGDYCECRTARYALGSDAPPSPEPEAVANYAELSAELNLESYWYGFSETGARVVDEILAAVVAAGNSFHSTERWADDDVASLPEGKSHVNMIQDAANRAARILRRAGPDDRTAGGGTG